MKIKQMSKYLLSSRKLSFYDSYIILRNKNGSPFARDFEFLSIGTKSVILVVQLFKIN